MRTRARILVPRSKMKTILATSFLLANIFWVDKSLGCIYVTVSSQPPDKLELNWFCGETIRSISLYDEDPRKAKDPRPLAKVIVDNPSRHYYKTNVAFEPEPFPGNWSRGEYGPRDRDGDLCLYWTLAEIEGQSPRVDCFKIQPAWMYQNKNKLKSLSLPQMFIPGTHNSGTDAMKTMRRKRGFGRLENFILTQDQSIWNQLVYGVRFLDLRIGYYPQNNDTDRRFWINHDLLRIRPLLPVLKEVVEFSKASPDEIIIMDFHRFPAGFNRKNALDVHKELVEFIGKEVKHFAIPRPLSQTKLKLEEIWASDKRIVVSYSEENMVWDTPWLWSSVSQRWGNKQIAEALEKFMDNTFRDVVSRKLWAIMAELTPTPLHFLSNESLRGMADSVNPLLNKWFAERRNWTSRANIVASDFFLGTNLVSVAVEENLRKAEEKD